jgi:transposase
MLGWTAPTASSVPGCECCKSQPRGAVRMTIIRIGLDTSKHVFQIHGVDENEKPVLQLRRGEVEKFFAKLPPTRIGIEACGASHHWARLLRGLGHTVMLMPPQYIKAYVKRGKNDAIRACPRARRRPDPWAAAIGEAMSRPTMRFVPVKTVESQAALTMLGVRDLLVKQRTMLINAIRGHAGSSASRRQKSLPSRKRGTPANRRAVATPGRRRERAGAGPRDARRAGGPARGGQWQAEGDRGAADGVASARPNQPVPGNDPRHRPDRRRQLCAQKPALAKAGVPDAKAFRSGRHFAAWIGITPRENSTAGKHRPGKISRAGDESLRRLLVLGATAVIQQAKTGRASPWLLGLLARKPKKLAAVALANKMARIIWAVMVSGETYRRPQEA